MIQSMFVKLVPEYQPVVKSFKELIQNLSYVDSKIHSFSSRNTQFERILNRNKVKALGILAMIDEGETDWKVMCIDVKDELADKINNLEDLENLKPG